MKLRVNLKKMIRVQAMNLKWGSGSSIGTIAFGADLVAQDEGFQDYVIVQELLHLRISSHERLFKEPMNA